MFAIIDSLGTKEGNQHLLTIIVTPFLSHLFSPRSLISILLLFLSIWHISFLFCLSYQCDSFTPSKKNLLLLSEFLFLTLSLSHLFSCFLAIRFFPINHCTSVFLLFSIIFSSFFAIRVSLSLSLISIHHFFFFSHHKRLSYHCTPLFLSVKYVFRSQFLFSLIISIPFLFSLPDSLSLILSILSLWLLPPLHQNFPAFLLLSFFCYLYPSFFLFSCYQILFLSFYLLFCLSIIVIYSSSIKSYFLSPFFFWLSEFICLSLSLSHNFWFSLATRGSHSLVLLIPSFFTLFPCYQFLSHIFKSVCFYLDISSNQYLYFHSQSLSPTPPPPPFLCCLCHFFHFDPRAACVIIFPFCDNHNFQAERIEANSQLDDETCPFYVVSKKFASIFIKTSSTPAKNKHLTEKSCSY